MKKFIVPILSLSLVFTTAIAVSAAPNVSGEVNFKMNDDHQSATKAVINMDGKLTSATSYNVKLQKDSVFAADMTESVKLDQASFTYNNKLGQVQFGQFAYNPTVMDMMDTTNFSEMKAPVAVKVTPNLGERVHLALGYQPNAANGFDQNAYQAELDYKLLENVSVGVNYQDLNDGSDAGLVWQVEAQPIEALSLYGEYGNKAGSDVEQGLVGAALTQGKFGIRGEYNMENDDWAAKASYKVTDNISTEFKATNGTYNELKVSYTF